MYEALDAAIVPLQSNGGSGIGGLIVILLYLAFLVGVIGGMWKTFAKAGHPGWAALIPFYNLYVMVEIADRPAWWLILFFIPLVNIVPSFIVPIDIADKFGKGTGFGLGLVFLGFIFYPILGFGDAQYEGHAA